MFKSYRSVTCLMFCILNLALFGLSQSVSKHWASHSAHSDSAVAGTVGCPVQGSQEGLTLSGFLIHFAPRQNDLQAWNSPCQRSSWFARLHLDLTVGICQIHVLDSCIGFGDPNLWFYVLGLSLCGCCMGSPCTVGRPWLSCISLMSQISSGLTQGRLPLQSWNSPH